MSQLGTTRMTLTKREALLDFIRTYKSLPELWDVGTPGYTDRAKKAIAYDILAKKLCVIEPGSTRDSVVKKINNIRSSFRKEWRKIKEYKKLGAPADEAHVPNLWYFKELMFIVDAQTRDLKDSSVDKGSELTEEEAAVSQINTPSTPTHTPTLYAALKKKRPAIPITATPNIFANSLPIETALPTPPRYLGKEDDDCLTLAKGYATKLRKLTPHQLMFADKLINEALLDAQLGLLTRNSYLVHSNSTTSESPAWNTHQMPPSNTPSEPEDTKIFFESLCPVDEDALNSAQT